MILQQFMSRKTKKNEMFQPGLFADAKAEGGRLVKEADFEAEKKINKKRIAFQLFF